MSTEKEKVIVSVPVDDFSFSDSDFSTVNEEASKFIEENKFDGNKVPVLFPSNGKFVIRVYPDRDKNGKLRYFKRSYIQKLIGLNDENEEVRINVYQDNSVEEKLISAEKNGLKDAWKYKAQEHVYVMVRLVECPVSDFYSPNTDGVLVLNKFQGIKFLEFFSGLSIDQLKSSLDVKNEYHPIEIIFEKGKISSIQFSSSKMKIDNMKLPDGCSWKGLDDAYINENTLITSQRREMFNRWLSQKVLSSSGLQDPIAEESSFFSSIPSSNKGIKTVSMNELIGEPKKDYSNDINATLINQQSSSSQNETCEIIVNKRNTGEYAQVRFGNPPKEADPDCTMCENQMSCFSKRTMGK